LEVGANEDTWGDELNANVISMIEEAITGIVSVSLTAGNVALSAANGTTDQSRNPLIVLTGTPGTTRTVTFPDVEKLTWVSNTSDSTATLTAGAGTAVSLPTESVALVYTDAATNVSAVSIAPIGGTHVTTSATQTLTSKTLTAPAISGATLSGNTTLPGSGQLSSAGLLGLGMAPVHILDITQTQNNASLVKIKNNSNGASAFAEFRAENDGSPGTVVEFGIYSSGYATTGLSRQAGAFVLSNAAGGLTVGTVSNQPVYIGVNDVQVAAFDASKLDLTVGQIKFPPSQSASADANTLDDYEEGTFTPTLTFGGNSVGTTYTTQVGAYTKIGNRVFFDLNIILSNKGSSTGLAAVGGLPFSSSATDPSSFPSLILDQVDLNVAGGFHSPGGDTDGATIILYEQGDNVNSANLTNADFGNTSRVNVSGAYRV
jgi:hypothetical protein